ncbi:hypothetical protein [Paenibacillus sp. FSL R5-0519]|uniref:hypothetical protein n=1 Tax=Paenibacillus sp. FSL R5-0519 TaxID=2921648 RepID=UPI0030DDA0BF
MKKLAVTISSVMLLSTLSSFSTNIYAEKVMDSQDEGIQYNVSKDGARVEYSTSYEEKDTGLNVELKITEEGDIRKVEHYVDNKFFSEATYNKAEDQVVTKLANGDEIIQKASDLVMELPEHEILSEEKFESDSAMGKNEIDSMMEVALNASPGYNFVRTKYNTAWNQYGSIYQKQSLVDTKVYRLNISAGTVVSTIASIIDIFATKGKVTALFRTLLYSTSGVIIDTIVGQMDAKKHLTQVEVYSQGLLGLRSERYIVTANINGRTAQIIDTGDERTYDELIDIGVYNVVLQKL